MTTQFKTKFQKGDKVFFISPINNFDYKIWRSEIEDIYSINFYEKLDKDVLYTPVSRKKEKKVSYLVTTHHAEIYESALFFTRKEAEKEITRRQIADLERYTKRVKYQIDSIKEKIINLKKELETENKKIKRWEKLKERLVKNAKTNAI